MAKRNDYKKFTSLKGEEIMIDELQKRTEGAGGKFVCCIGPDHIDTGLVSLKLSNLSTSKMVKNRRQTNSKTS